MAVHSSVESEQVEAEAVGCGDQERVPRVAGYLVSSSVVSRVANVHGLRNRVAHLEPLHRYDLRRVRRDMRSVCHAIGPDAARFFVQNERLLAVIESNPAGQS